MELRRTGSLATFLVLLALPRFAFAQDAEKTVFTAFTSADYDVRESDGSDRRVEFSALGGVRVTKSKGGRFLPEVVFTDKLTEAEAKRLKGVEQDLKLFPESDGNLAGKRLTITVSDGKKFRVFQRGSAGAAIDTLGELGAPSSSDYAKRLHAADEISAISEGVIQRLSKASSAEGFDEIRYVSFSCGTLTVKKDGRVTLVVQDEQGRRPITVDLPDRVATLQGLFKQARFDRLPQRLDVPGSRRIWAAFELSAGWPVGTGAGWRETYGSVALPGDEDRFSTGGKPAEPLVVALQHLVEGLLPQARRAIERERAKEMVGQRQREVEAAAKQLSAARKALDLAKAKVAALGGQPSKTPGLVRGLEQVGDKK